MKAIEIHAGVGAYHAGWVLIKSTGPKHEIETYLFRCMLLEWDVSPDESRSSVGDNLIISTKDREQKWTGYIVGMNDTYEGGYTLMIDHTTLIRVENDLTPDYVWDLEDRKENIYTDAGDETSPTDEGRRIKYLCNPLVSGWRAPEVDQ